MQHSRSTRKEYVGPGVGRLVDRTELTSLRTLALVQAPAPAWVRLCRGSRRQDQAGSLAEATPAEGEGPHEESAGPKCPVLPTRTGMVAVQARGPQLAQQEFPSLGGGAAPDKPAAAVPQPVPTQAPHSNGPSSLHGHRAQDPVANWQPSRGDMQGEVWG